MSVAGLARKLFKWSAKTDIFLDFLDRMYVDRELIRSISLTGQRFRVLNAINGRVDFELDIHKDHTVRITFGSELVDTKNYYRID